MVRHRSSDSIPDADAAKEYEAARANALTVIASLLPLCADPEAPVSAVDLAAGDARRALARLCEASSAALHFLTRR